MSSTPNDLSSGSAPATYPRCVPILTDGRVLLRPHDAGDVERIVEQCNDPVSVEWTTVPVPYGVDAAREWLEIIKQGWSSPTGPFLWAITDAADPDTFLGTIDVRPQGAGIATIGFGLHPEGRGRHLMSGAVRLVTRWWFDRGGVRMIWEANRGNFASWRVAHACGFAFHGVLPQHLDHRGEPTDAYYGSVGRDDDLTRPVTSWREAVVIDDGGLRLRPWQERDAAHLADETADESPSHFMPPGAAPTSGDFAHWLRRRRERMAFGEATHWCIADTDTDDPLGEALLIDRGQPPGTAELGYQLLPSARGRGVATAAARLVIEHAFAPAPSGGRGLRLLTATSVGDNAASARVLQRLGFTETGRGPQSAARADGTFDDLYHWVLFAPSP